MERKRRVERGGLLNRISEDRKILCGMAPSKFILLGASKQTP